MTIKIKSAMTMTTTIVRHFLVLWLGILLGAAVEASDQTIVWVIPGPQGMATRYASVGDTFTFLFQTGSHSVNIHPTEDCDPTGSYAVGAAGDGATKYTFRERDVGRRVFACQVADHCSVGGLIMLVHVSPNPDYEATTPDDDGVMIDKTAENDEDGTTSSAVTVLGEARLSFFSRGRISKTCTTSITELLMMTRLGVIAAASLTVLMTTVLLG